MAPLDPIQTTINDSENSHVYGSISPAKSISPRQFKRTNQISATHFRKIAHRLYIILEGNFTSTANLKQFCQTSVLFPFQLLKTHSGVMLATAEAPKPTLKRKAPAVKEKKPKAAAKMKKPKAAKTSSHPPYFEMIKEALLALNEKGGSSPYAIAKYMEEKHKSVLPANFRKILGLQLKNSTVKEKLIKIKASFKLSDAGKKNNPKLKPGVKKPAAVTKKATTKKPAGVTKKAAVTKAIAKKPGAATASKKATAASVGTKRKAVAKKTEGVKKVAPKKAVAAKPKSIKSPAAKKTKRVKV